MAKSKIDLLCEYLDENTAEQYPVLNKELADNTDYIKNGYLKMLAVVLQQSGEISNAQLEMFRRIVAGAETEKRAEDFLRMALEIEVEDYIRFTVECKELELRYRWILDAIILTCTQERTKEQLRLIAHFCEAYEVSKEELEYIAMMAKAIVCMREEDYVTAYEMQANSVPDSVFSDYMYLILDDCICCNEHMTIFRPTYREEVTAQALERIGETDTPCITIIGAVIDMSTCKIAFSDKQKVILEDCCFTGGNKNAVNFVSCGEVIIKKCLFNNFSSRTLIFNEVASVVIEDCEFLECRFKYNTSSDAWKALGGVIYSEKPTSIGRCDLIGTSFEKCGGINVNNYYRYYRSAIISNIKCVVDGCNFNNCWNYGLMNNIDPEDERRTMFVKASSATNCSYENTAVFN